MALDDLIAEHGKCVKKVHLCGVLKRWDVKLLNEDLSLGLILSDHLRECDQSLAMLILSEPSEELTELISLDELGRLWVKLRPELNILLD